LTELPPDRDPEPTPGVAAAAGGALLMVAALVIYRAAIVSYLFNDDFNWFDDAHRFAFANLFPSRPLRSLLPAGRRDLLLRRPALLRLRRATVSSPERRHSSRQHADPVPVRPRAERRSETRLSGGGVLRHQPGYYEAVAWVAAITDLLPGLWYLLALWLWLRFLHDGRVAWYAGALASFTACLLTHESSATLLPMLVALDVTVRAGAHRRIDAGWIRHRLVVYLPFAVLLVASLTITYIVNSRSYLIREGHYQLGWHAVPHMLQFILSLYVGPDR
jgi:hypothetical protein